MSHIHTEPGQHDLTASAYIVRTDQGQPAVLLHLHRKLGKWLQFGGHVELNENPWQAVTREIQEESGYELSQLKLLKPPVKQPHLTGAVSHPYPANIQTHKFGDLDHYHTDIAYAFVTDQEPTNQIADDESRNFRAFTIGELEALSDDEIPSSVRDLAIFILKECAPSWQQVSVA